MPARGRAAGRGPRAQPTWPTSTPTRSTPRRRPRSPWQRSRARMARGGRSPGRCCASISTRRSDASPSTRAATSAARPPPSSAHVTLAARTISSPRTAPTWSLSAHRVNVHCDAPIADDDARHHRPLPVAPHARFAARVSVWSAVLRSLRSSRARDPASPLRAVRASGRGRRPRRAAARVPPEPRGRSRRPPTPAPRSGARAAGRSARPR
jgi:hypothetical protein